MGRAVCGSGGKGGEDRLGEVSAEDACPNDIVGDGNFRSAGRGEVWVEEGAVTGGCANGLDGILGDIGGDEGGEGCGATMVLLVNDRGEGLCTGRGVVGVPGFDDADSWLGVETDDGTCADFDRFATAFAVCV